MLIDQPGIYWGLLTEATLGKAKTGSPQMTLTFSVTHGFENSGDPMKEAVPVGPVDRRVYLSLTDRAMHYTSEKLQRLGFNGDFRSPEFSENAKHEGVKLLCTENSYQGNISMRYDIARADRPAAVSLDDRDLAALTAKFSAATGGAKPKETQRDKAWKTWCANSSDDPDLEKWNAAVKAVGKPEKQFSATDWQTVADASIPI